MHWKYNFLPIAPMVIAAACAALSCGAALGNTAKLDATLRRLSEQSSTDPSSAQTLVQPQIKAAKTIPMLEASVHFSGSGLADLRALGVTVRSVVGDVATVVIPHDKLTEVAALTSVHRIEAARRPVVRLDQSVPTTRASLLRSGQNSANWSGGTGEGVLVGLIDTGLDLTHPDFRNPDGTSRVLYLWNQRDDAKGAPPIGDDGRPLYGAECDASQINQALRGTDNGCKVPDNYGHGTHVAGIIAGNGQASGYDQAFNRFVGMAPKADFIVANAMDEGVGPENSVLDAVAYMVRKAKSLQRPIVINLSLGSYFGPRDGTSPLERALDNASGPGMVIVAAVGNEGSSPLRATGRIEQGQSINIGFSMPSYTKAQTIEGWYDGANRYSISLSCGAFSTPVVAAGGSYLKDTPCGKVQVTSTEPNPGNGDRQILVNLGDGVTYLHSGDWVLGLTAQQVGGNNNFSFISGERQTDINFTSHTEAPFTSEIITDTASARRVIAVASYNTRSSWNSRSGATTRSDMGELGDISNFSSRGPRRMCSNAQLCPPVMKPEITAPGAYVISAYTSANTWVKPLNMQEADGVHVAISGTSMSTAHVSGAVALLLQASPQLTPENAKRVLATTTQSNAFAAASTLPNYSGADLPPSPNYAWGYGVMDAAAAFRTHVGFSVAAGWSLLGNTLNAPLEVASLIGSSSASVAGVTANVHSLWKWEASANGGNGRWAFYAPTMGAAELASYANSKGYAVLTTLQPGEGFWINAKQPVTLPIQGGMAYSLPIAEIAANWSLVATGFETAPAAFNTALGNAALDNFKTLWAWDSARARWYFYAPSLDRDGTLNGYETAKDYLDFAADNKKLSHGVGFWVNR